MIELKRRILFFFLGLPILASSQFATQMFPIYADYSAWNPAAISPSGLFNGGVNYFSDSGSSESQTKMMNASFHYPIKFQKMAGGGYLTRNDFAGIKQTKLGLGFKYTINFSLDNSLDLGIGTGFYFTRLNDDNFVANDPGDVLITSDKNSVFDLNINSGLVYRHTFRSGFASEVQSQRLIVSFSAQEILNRTKTLYSDAFSIERGNYFFTLLGYSHPLIPNIGTTFYYTNSYSSVFGMNHTGLVSFDFSQAFDVDLGYNSVGKVIIGTGFAFSNIREDDRLRVKLGWTYDTRAITSGNQIGFNLSMFYTYDYDYTSFEM